MKTKFLLSQLFEFMPLVVKTANMGRSLKNLLVPQFPCIFENESLNNNACLKNLSSQLSEFSSEGLWTEFSISPFWWIFSIIFETIAQTARLAVIYPSISVDYPLKARSPANFFEWSWKNPTVVHYLSGLYQKMGHPIFPRGTGGHAQKNCWR